MTKNLEPGKFGGRLSAFRVAGLYFLLVEFSTLAAHRFLVGSRPEYIVGGLFFSTSLWIAFLVQERRHSEDTLGQYRDRTRAISEAPLGAVVEIDQAGKIISWNAWAEKLFGWPAEEVFGRKLSETILPGRFRERHEQDFKQFLATAKGAILNCSIETTALHRDGREFPVELTVTSLRQRDGPIVAAFVRDISARKRAREEIVHLNADLTARAAELEDINRELEAFNYAVAHDLRKPLTAVIGYCQILQEQCSDVLDEECRGYLQEVFRGTWQMNLLIDTLLDFSQSTRAEPVREPIDLSGLAQSVGEELHLVEPNRRVTFRIAEEIRATGDATLLRVVLENLLDNAWKYTGKRDEAIIEFGLTKSRGDPVYFVRDNGSGFNMAEVNKLFMPFQRLPGTQEFKGHGIGLATVERIIRRHGGRIWAEGKPGEGATFYFTLAEGESK